MPRAVAMTCPNCGANLEAPEDATGATCSYCGQSCVIRGRTRFLQLPRPLPSVPHGVRVVIPPVNASRLAVRALAPLLGSAIAIGASVYRASTSSFPTTTRTTTTITSTTTTTITTSVRTPRPAAWWGNAPPLLRDLNGDGVDDVIGTTRANGVSVLHLAAFDGATGARLWESPPLGDAATLAATAFLADELVLRSDSNGVIRAFDATTGAARWAAPIGERVGEICATATAGVVEVQTADGALRRLTLADGAMRGAPRPKGRRRQGCGTATPVPSTTRRPSRWRGRALPGLAARFEFRRGDATILSAYKSPGTAVPMLARVKPDGASIAWLAQVPAQHPLTSSFRDELVAMTEELVFTMYRANELPVPHLTALSLADGARRWDVELPGIDLSGATRGLLVNQRAVLVAASNRLLALELDTGKLLFTLGEQ